MDLSNITIALRLILFYFIAFLVVYVPVERIAKNKKWYYKGALLCVVSLIFAIYSVHIGWRISCYLSGPEPKCGLGHSLIAGSLSFLYLLMGAVWLIKDRTKIKKVTPTRKNPMNIKAELISVLEQTIFYIKQSKDSPWSPSSTNEVFHVIKKELSKLKANQRINKDKLKLEFAATSSIQEISTDNNWGDKYLELSKKFDSLINKIDVD